MQTVKVFKTTRGLTGWNGVCRGLTRKGFPVNVTVQDCDVAIILSGKYENPLAFTGKKNVLIVETGEWQPSPYCWDEWIFPALKEYYNEFIDVSGFSNEDIVKTVVEYIESETKKPRNPN